MLFLSLNKPMFSIPRKSSLFFCTCIAKRVESTTAAAIFSLKVWKSLLQFGMHFLPKFLRYLLYLYSFQRQRWLCKEKLIFNAHKMKSLYPSKILQRTHLTRSCGAMSYCLFEHFSHFIITARNWQFSTKVWTYVIGLSCFFSRILQYRKVSKFENCSMGVNFVITPKACCC